MPDKKVSLINGTLRTVDVWEDEEMIMSWRPARRGIDLPKALLDRHAAAEKAFLAADAELRRAFNRAYTKKYGRQRITAISSCA